MKLSYVYHFVLPETNSCLKQRSLKSTDLSTSVVASNWHRCRQILTARGEEVFARHAIRDRVGLVGMGSSTGDGNLGTATRPPVEQRWRESVYELETARRQPGQTRIGIFPVYPPRRVIFDGFEAYQGHLGRLTSRKTYQSMKDHCQRGR